MRDGPGPCGSLLGCGRASESPGLKTAWGFSWERLGEVSSHVSIRYVVTLELYQGDTVCHSEPTKYYRSCTRHTVGQGERGLILKVGQVQAGLGILKEMASL